MKDKIPAKLRVIRFSALSVLVFGILLMTFMIIVESEPGALPLLLVLGGMIWFLYNEAQIRRHSTRR